MIAVLIASSQSSSLSLTLMLMASFTALTAFQLTDGRLRRMLGALLVAAAFSAGFAMYWDCGWLPDWLCYI